MDIWTNWVCYDDKVGITKNGEFYELSTMTKLIREYHNGQIKYRKNGCTKRYSWNKCNKTKILKKVLIIELPF